MESGRNGQCGPNVKLVPNKFLWTPNFKHFIRHWEYLKLSANVPFFGGKCLPSKSPSMHRIHPNKCRSPRIWPTLKRHRPKLTKKNILKNKLSARIRFVQKSLPKFILPSKICERRSRRSRFSQCLWVGHCLDRQVRYLSHVLPSDAFVIVIV